MAVTERPPFRELADWLAWVERQHPKSIALGLDRVARVRDALRQQTGCNFDGPIVTVGGTNGKGSTCAMLEAILRAAGYRVGLYTSPHLLRYNERVRIDGVAVSDEQLCASFTRVEAARRGLVAVTSGEPLALTYFEYGTLVAWEIFCGSGLDVVILEVGLGGRLDAVNIFDADCAVLTSIDLDHMDYLGDTREKIGAEKAGIFRPGKVAVVADPLPPASVAVHAERIGADLRLLGRDFGYRGDKQQWQYWSRDSRRSGLAYPALRGANQLLNASAALAALDAIAGRAPVGMDAVRRGFSVLDLPGRFQVLPGRPTVVLDVAHNPHAAAVLSDNLSNMGFFPGTCAVFGMLGDKDIAGVCRAMRGRISAWHVAALPGPRGARAETLVRAIASSEAGGEVRTFDSHRAAYAEARRRAGEGDRIIVFGSFLTVADVLAAIRVDNRNPGTQSS
ncbi:MAG: bifunctional tetrahydrofolate synthase/dihydrofolate synthase [Betaproteobacteria bacterium]|nr:bifunctional tetrahydrofolate synthase/dihydrofolate synthase [Betaproteobacteria bacterium]